MKTEKEKSAETKQTTATPEPTPESQQARCASDQQAKPQPGNDAAPQTVEDCRAMVNQLSDEDLVAMVQKSRERDFFLESLQRAQADYHNYQKRVEREQENFRRYAESTVLSKILVVLDHFERALAAARQTRDLDAFLEGITLVEKEFRKTLNEVGVKPIEAVGQKFDPNYHEALRQEERADVADMQIVEEYEKGYLFHDRVLRPSKVVVARKPQGSAGASKGSEAPETNGKNPNKK